MDWYIKKKREMNGIDYLVDTNILVYILQGNPHVKYFAESEILTISCITEMEVLGKFQISESEKQIIRRFINRCRIIEIDPLIKQLAINIKQQNRIKLPDAIIAATAIKNDILLVTADKGYRKISNLDLLLIDISI